MKDAKKPDLNAPRYRKGHQTTLDNEYCEKLKLDIPSLKELSNEQIKFIITSFNETIYEKVIDVRDGVELPEQIGHLFLGTCPPKKSKNVDFKKSAEYLKVIQHRNWESDNYLAKIFFTTYGTKYRFKHHEIWGFNAYRDFTRKVGVEYPKKWKMYLVIDPFRKISTLYKKNVYKHYKQKENKDLLNDYNELEI